MKHSWMLVLLCISVADPRDAVYASGNNEMSDQKHSFANVFVGKIKEGAHLKDVLVHASTSDVPFCREEIAHSGPPPKAKDWSALSNKSVEAFLAALDSEGFVCTRSDRAILVADPEAKGLKKNPLDSRLQGFKFKGSHQAFLIALAKQIQGLPPNIIGSSGLLSSVTYEININEEIAVRDLLLHLASSYGIAWTATIAKEVPVYAIESPDGTNVRAEGSNLTLVFYPCKRPVEERGK